MLVMLILTGSPSGSVTPVTDTFMNLWLGGQREAGVATAALQSGDCSALRVVVVDDVVVVVGVGRVVVVVDVLVVVG